MAEMTCSLTAHTPPCSLLPLRDAQPPFEPDHTAVAGLVDVHPESDVALILCQAAYSVSRRSVTNMCPGLCVIIKGGRALMATACGVTPHAQKTGTWFSAISTGSPNSGSFMSLTPNESGSPTCTGAPCIVGNRPEIATAWGVSSGR